jgi:hypothetical protein
MENMPIRKRKYLEEAIKQIMDEFCQPIEIAPRTIKGSKRLLTTRWEMLVKALPGKNLAETLPSIIEIDDQKVLLSWSGSPPTCLQCLTAGHSRQNCPKRAKLTGTPKQGNGNTKPSATPQPNKSTTYAKTVANQSQATEGESHMGQETQGPTNKPYNNRLLETPEPRIPSIQLEDHTPNLQQYQMEGVVMESTNLNLSTIKRSYAASPTPSSRRQSTTSLSYDEAFAQYEQQHKLRKTNPDSLNNNSN